MAPKYYAAPKLLFGITEDKDHNDMNKNIHPQGFLLLSNPAEAGM